MIIRFLQRGRDVIAERGRHIGGGGGDPAEPVGSGEDASTNSAAVISVNGNGQRRRVPATRRPNRRVMLLIGLGVVSRLLRDPRFQARVITVALGLTVLKRAAQESGTQNFERVGGFFEGNRVRLEGKAKKVEGKAKKLEGNAKKAFAQPGDR